MTVTRQVLVRSPPQLVLMGEKDEVAFLLLDLL